MIASIIFATLLITGFATAQAVNYGQTTHTSNTDSYGNSNLGIYLEFTSGSAAQYAVNSCSFYAVQQGLGSIECGIYTDNSGRPGSMLCHGSYLESSDAPSVLVTVPLAGCGTLNANTNYWVLTNTTDDGFVIGVSGCSWNCTGNYPSSNTPDWYASVAYGTYPSNPSITEDTGRQTQYVTVTPSSSRQVAEPVDSPGPGSGSYQSAKMVTLHDATPSATICYTTDGSDPTAATPGTCSHGETYSSGFTVSSTTTVKAIGTEAIYANSVELTSIYTISPIVFVQEQECRSTGTSVTCAYASPVMAGDALMVVVSPLNTSGAPYTISVSDNLNGAWTQNGGPCFCQFTAQAATFYFLNSKPGNITIAVSSSTNTTINSSIVEYAGVATSGAVDVPASCVYASGTATPNVTTTNADDLILASLGIPGNGGEVSVSIPYTLRGLMMVSRIPIADQIVSATSTYAGAQFDLEYGGPVFGITATYKAVEVAPPPPPIALTAASPSPYTSGSSQGFIATLTDQNGNPESGVVVTFDVTGANSNTGTGTTDSNGIASYAYIGANAGNDNVQASANVNHVQVTSNSVAVSWATPSQTTGEGSVVLLTQPSIGLGGLLGAFTDSNGTLIEPIAIGATPRDFVTPAGATQIQLGVNDDGFWNNLGTGFVVQVNGTSVTVPPTSPPWIWAAGGLNTTYQFGYTTGITNPVVALTALKQGEDVSVVYGSGNVSVGPCCSAYDANGNPGAITGTSVGLGDYYATLYMTAASYPVGQPVSITAVVTNGAGSPLPNVPVVLDITGANVRQLQAVTNSTGTASFTYSGIVAGTDILKAQAVPDGETTLVSTQTSIAWVNFTTPPKMGTLALTPTSIQPLPFRGQQAFTVLASDASGSPVPNIAVSLIMTGVDNFGLSATTDATGHATFLYQDVNSGTASVQAVASINNAITYSNVVSVPWTLPASTASTSGGSGTLNISISAENTVVLPSTLQLNGTVTDSSLPAGDTIAVTWSQISGPSTATLANPQQTVTTASFSQQGNYVLELSASDSVNSGSVQFPVTVNPVPGTTQGWIGSPAYGATVSGLVPITVASGVTLQSGTLTYYPANNINDVVVLNADTTGSGQIGSLDTTTLPNGSYWLELQASDTTGDMEYSIALVTVAGNYKPGRVTATVTDLVVPAVGLAINIQRTYDSLNANVVGDFGYGWTLGTNVNLTVDPSGNVTFTLGGQRRTFYFTPQFGGSFLPFYFAAFTSEPGFHGTLTDSAPGCTSDFDFLAQDGSEWDCIGGGLYNPPGYVYIDPSGTSYFIKANGVLQSIIDKNGNALTIGANGITSTTGLNVPFLRDSQGRITRITDPQGNVYLYTYDSNGNLATVTYPGISQPSTYTYDDNHRYTGGTDARGNPLPTTQYYPDGRLQSVTDAMGKTTSYAYDLTTNTTTVTYPADASGAVGTATMVYDPYGMLLTSTDPLGHTTTNVYDTNHNLTSITDALGNVTTHTYDSNGNPTSTTYPKTATSTNTTGSTAYNQYGEPTSTTDELGNVRTFTYDANYNPLSVTDSTGTLAGFQFNSDGTLQAGAIGYDISTQPSKASHFTYDANGNLTGRTDALGRVTSSTYDSLGHKISMTEPLPNSTTTYTYDALGNLTQTAAPLGRTTSSTYDANDNKVTDTDALGHVTSYQYDALNRLIKTTYPDSTTDTRTYDFRNNIVDEVDQAGHDMHYTYDLAGRLVSLTHAYGASDASTTTYTYDADGRKLSETDPLGHTTSYTYDAAGNLTVLSGAKGNFQYGYDNARNRVSMTDGNTHTTSYQYDSRKRLVQTTYPDSTTVTNAYDGPGNLNSVTDQAGNVVQYTYDAANQMQTVVQVNSPNSSANTTSYGYDPLGDLTGLTDANGHATQNSFDVLLEPVSKTLPDGTLTETRTYDPAGNLLSLKHFNGTTTTYTYDGLNRLLTRTPDPSLNEPAVTFTYTATGKRASMTDASGTTTYTYDDLDRLTTKATPEGTLNYTYDAVGDLASMSSSDGNVSVSYTWDSLNRLSTVAGSRLGTTTYSYDGANNLATATYPNHLQSSYSYDPENRLTYLVTPPAAGYSYQLGPTGNRTGAAESSGRTLTWSYDGIYRLTNETITSDPSHNNGSVGYGLDPVGNRLSESATIPGIGSGSFNYNADDELAAENYDSNGNVTSSGDKSFAYDSEDRLKSMNGGAVTIVYDGDGNRVAKTAGGVITRYLVDDLNPTGYAQVVEETGSVQRTYTYGLQRIGEYQVINGTPTPSFYGYDGFGSVRQVTNSSGAMTDTYEYDAFGNKINSTGTTPNTYLYRGEQFDADLGLYYLRARYYNQVTGRFMSRDPEDGRPIDPKTLHKYLYSGGDPVNAIDPTGRDLVEEVVDLTVHEQDTARFGHEIGECITAAFQSEGETSGAVSTGNAIPKPDLNVGIDLVHCGYDALKGLTFPGGIKFF